MTASRELFSLVLPCRNQADHIEAVLDRYRVALEAVPHEVELIVVPNACTDDTVQVVQRLADADRHIRAVPLEQGGWGRAVRAGLSAARGTWLGYTNTARTDPETVPNFLAQALEFPSAIVKAWRRERQAPFRSLGSLLYNFEARLLFGLRCHDVNGTPKVFTRDLYQSVDLQETGDLLDLEFLSQAERLGRPVVEIPLTGFKRHGGKSSTTLGSAWGMYSGAFRLWLAGRNQGRAA